MVTKYVTTDILELAYLEHGPASGRPVLLLHGFPDDATSWDAVADRLAGHGARVLAPHTRGVGPTRFRLDETSRTGQLAALVTDAVAFLDALGVRRVTVAGQDWGARVAQGLAALNPERVEHLVSTDTGTDARYDGVEATLAAAPRVEVPTTVLLGADDGIEQPAVDDPRDAHFFPHLRSRLLLEGVGHWPHREAPELVADALTGEPLTSSGNAQARQ